MDLLTPTAVVALEGDALNLQIIRDTLVANVAKEAVVAMSARPTIDTRQWERLADLLESRASLLARNHPNHPCSLHDHPFPTDEEAAAVLFRQTVEINEILTSMADRLGGTVTYVQEASA